MVGLFAGFAVLRPAAPRAVPLLPLEPPGAEPDVLAQLGLDVEQADWRLDALRLAGAAPRGIAPARARTPRNR